MTRATTEPPTPGRPAAHVGAAGVPVAPAGRLRPWVFDVALTAALIVLGTVLHFTYRPDDGVQYREPDLLGLVMVIAYTLPLLVRRTAPLTVALVLAVLNLPYLVWNYPAPSSAVVALIAAYSLGAHAPVVRGLIGLAAMLAGTYVYLWDVTEEFPDASDVGAAAALVIALASFGAWAVGRSVRVPRMHAQDLQERAEQLERTHDAEVRAALAEERGQIARELHDVVAHHVSVMTVQAAGARRTLERDPERSRQALEAIEETGRTALGEMRRIVGILRGPREDASDPAGGKRSSDGTTDGRAPQPGAGDLPALVQQLRAAGLPVTLTTENDHMVRPPLGLELAVFRIVQEALTNTLKHAPGAHAEVTVRHTADQVEVTVTDDGPGHTYGPVGRRPGHGLLGMRERVVLYGGQLRVGDRPGGGFEVRACLPVRDDA